MKPTVSVVIPTYNYGRYLAGAVRSALTQSYTDIEVLIVDDGSTDRTADVARDLSSDSRVRYFPQPNRGPAAARNRGIAQARGEFVAFLDADDRWLPTKLERQLPLFAATDVGLVYGRRRLIDATDRERDYLQPTLYRGRVLEHLFLDNFVCFSSAMARRSVVLELGGFCTTVQHSEDYELLLRLTARYAVDYVDEPVVLYRTGHGNLSSQTEKRFRAVCGIMERFTASEGKALPQTLVRRAWAETYCHWGFARRDATWLGAARMLAKALAWQPRRLATWRELGSLTMTNSGRGLARWLLRY